MLADKEAANRALKQSLKQWRVKPGNLQLTGLASGKFALDEKYELLEKDERLGLTVARTVGVRVLDPLMVANAIRAEAALQPPNELLLVRNSRCPRSSQPLRLRD